MATFSFFHVSVQIMTTRGHYQYSILCIIDKQCMRKICVKTKASAVFHNSSIKESKKSTRFCHF